jgi:hypothetical protein
MNSAIGGNADQIRRRVAVSIFRTRAQIVTLLLGIGLVVASAGAWMAFGALTSGSLATAATSSITTTVALSKGGSAISALPCTPPAPVTAVG